jgi:hypothetical protein
MMERAMPSPHPAKPKWKCAFVKAHCPQALFVAFDFDAEAIVGFDNTNFVDYFLRHQIYASFRPMLSLPTRMHEHFEEIVSMLYRYLEEIALTNPARAITEAQPTSASPHT